MTANKTKRSTRKIRRANDKFKFTVGSIYNYLTGVNVIAIVTILLTAFSVCVLSYKVSELKKENSELHMEYQQVVSQYNAMNEKFDALTDNRDELLEITTEMSDQYHALYDEYKEYQELVGYSREKIYDIGRKYSFIMDTIPETSELTLENLIYMDELCEKANINPYVVTSIFYNESRFDSTAKNKKSSATGLGQIVEGTGEYLYHNVLGYTGEYNHSVMAKDPKLNIEMTVAYIEWLKNRYKGDLSRSLLGYSGGSEDFANTIINRLLTEHGSSTFDYM